MENSYYANARMAHMLICLLSRGYLMLFCIDESIDNRPTEKGLETRNFLAISHFGARYDHVI